MQFKRKREIESQTSYTFYELMIIVLNSQHKNPMNLSVVKTIGCNHGLSQEVLEGLLTKLFKKGKGRGTQKPELSK